MLAVNQFQLFSEYNLLMNQRIYGAASRLSDIELNRDSGAFFRSIIGTLNHIIVGDIIWLKRFSNHPSSEHALSYISQLNSPKTLDSLLYRELAQLEIERVKLDNIIIQWINGLSAQDIKDSITYHNMAGTQCHKPFASLISHLFLHQVHHRGQVTTLLAQLDVNFGDTDLIEIIHDEDL